MRQNLALVVDVGKAIYFFAGNVTGGVALALLRVFRLTLFVAGLAAGLPSAAARAAPSLTSRGLAAFSEARYAEALEDWQKAAETGDPQAALYIGLLHDLGRGVEQDAQTARRWYGVAAALGNPIAMFNIGVIYDAGVGVAGDRAMAVEWYKKAAAAGMGRAAYNLGLIYETGDGVSRDREQAVQYFREALARGVRAAQVHLAALGEPTGKNERSGGEARNTGRDAGLAAFDQAQGLLLRRTTQAEREAAAILRQAAEAGDLLAAYDLGYCLEKGIGLPADRQQAYIWYRRAAMSPTPTVRSAAQAGAEKIARDLTPAQLAAAKSSVASPLPDLTVKAAPTK